MSTTLGKVREYETVFVVNPELTDDQFKEVVERLKGVITKMKGELLREDHWGKRKLAYESKKHVRGNYLLMHYVGPVGVVGELERTMRNIEHVFRFVTSLKGEVDDIDAKRAEVEKMARERADKARQEAEKQAAAEAEAQAAS